MSNIGRSGGILPCSDEQRNKLLSKGRKPWHPNWVREIPEVRIRFADLTPSEVLFLSILDRSVQMGQNLRTHAFGAFSEVVELQHTLTNEQLNAMFVEGAFQLEERDALRLRGVDPADDQPMFDFFSPIRWISELIPSAKAKELNSKIEALYDQYKKKS